MPENKVFPLEKLKPALPWLSLAGAVWSGLTIARDFAHGWRLLVFAVGFFFVLAFFRWFISRIDSQEGRSGGVSPSTSFWTRIAVRRDRIEWLLVSLAQIQVQYVLMFSIPFLFWSGAWWLLVVVALVVLSTLWDPWWQRLILYPQYGRFVRSLCALLATSFVVSIFAPKLSGYAEILSIIFAVVASVPWRRLLDERSIGKWVGCTLGSIPTVLWALCLVAALLGFRAVPLLSVWVESDAGLGFDVESRRLVERIDSHYTRARLQEGFAGGRKLCCWTPIVAPRALREKIIHSWYVDGRHADTISLGDMVGLDDSHAFRTFSCKTALEFMDSLKTIRCVVQLESGPEIGSVQIEVE